jgi:uncharacterized membrane protein YccF (DUF307 family)
LPALGSRIMTRQHSARFVHARESAVEVYQVLLLMWVIVFGWWIARQFSEYNKRTEKKD